MINWKDTLKKGLRYFKRDAEKDENANAFMKKKQSVWGCVVILVMVIFVVVLHSLAQNNQKKQPAVAVSHQKALDGILSTDFTEKDSLSALEAQQHQVDHLNHQVDALTKLTKHLEQMKIEGAKEKSVFLRNNPVNKILLPVVEKPHPVLQTTTIPAHAQMATITFNYQPPRHLLGGQALALHRPVSRKNKKNWVPAGTFSRGVLLEGADANASVNGQSDTVPILIRLLGSGTLPNGGHSSLKGCFVVASIYGDISSERGEVRLKTLSCTHHDGSILEKNVHGYVSFAGKEGIKGTPVMRNGKILTMAGISGALSGIGSALQQTTQTLNTNGYQTMTHIQPNQIWQNGAYGGGSTAMNQLANYYIKRANQYHPVISVGSGTVATVIFQTGFSLKDEKTTVTQHVDNHSTQELKNLLVEAQKSHHVNAPFTNLASVKLGQTLKAGE